MIRNALAFLAGILWVQTRGQLDDLTQAAPWLLAIAAACAYWRPKWLAVLLVGILWAWWRATLALEAQHWADPTVTDYRVTGVVSSIPELEAGVWQFDFTVDEAWAHGLPQRLRLSV